MANAPQHTPANDQQDVVESIVHHMPVVLPVAEGGSDFSAGLYRRVHGLSRQVIHKSRVYPAFSLVLASSHAIFACNCGNPVVSGFKMRPSCRHTVSGSRPYPLPPDTPPATSPPLCSFRAPTETNALCTHAHATHAVKGC